MYIVKKKMETNHKIKKDTHGNKNKKIVCNILSRKRKRESMYIFLKQIIYWAFQ